MLRQQATLPTRPLGDSALSITPIGNITLIGHITPIGHGTWAIGGDKP